MRVLWRFCACSSCRVPSTVLRHAVAGQEESGCVYFVDCVITLKMSMINCKSDNFHTCNFSPFSNFQHFCLSLNSLLSAILHRPLHKTYTFAHFQFHVSSRSAHKVQKLSSQENFHYHSILCQETNPWIMPSECYIKYMYKATF